MKYIPIVPTMHMKDVLMCGDSTLVLAHLLTPNSLYLEKCKEFKELGGKIILDNSFYELRRNLSIKECIEKCKLIEPDVFVLPDIKYKSDTKGILQTVIKALRENDIKSKLMGVVTVCKTFSEELRLFEVLNSMQDIDIIAVPYSFRQRDSLRRPHFLTLIEKVVGKKNIKPIHLFGLNSLENIEKEKREYVVSIDGTIAWKCGYYGMKLPVNRYKEPKRPEHYFDIENVDILQRECIDYNMKYMKEVCEK